MTDIPARYVRLAAYVVGEELARRQRYGHPIPQALHQLLAALNSALSVCGQPAPPDVSRLKTTKQLATEWGCTARTVRRKAAAAGGRKIHNRWIFEEDT